MKTNLGNIVSVFILSYSSSSLHIYAVIHLLIARFLSDTEYLKKSKSLDFKKLIGREIDKENFFTQFFVNSMRKMGVL